MALGNYQHQVTLDTRDGDPLDPPTWYCASGGNTNGIAVLTGPYHSGISTATRVHLKDKLYHVTSILNVGERDRELVLSCTEVYD